MKVHIVCPNLSRDRILPRLAKSLADATGWPLSEYPDPSVDINYFMIYINYAQRFPNWHKTKVACYFSHYEMGNGAKERWWHHAAANSDLAIITASRYEKKLLEVPTCKVRPPVDSMFKPAEERPDNPTPVIGVGGFASARKGLDLIKQLSTDYNVAFSGRGWPGAVWYSWDAMPEFYHSLDVYVCTSLVEGIPMPPLEALACNIPVVIPRDVGMLDDLQGPGIYKYTAGDYPSLVRNLKKALGNSNKTPNVKLNNYTPANWALDHINAFEDFLFPENIDLPDWEGNSGMYCVAFGKPSRRCAVRCIESFKKHSKVPVALASTESLGPEDVFVKMDDIDIGGRLAKLAAYKSVPEDWQYVLYLDADTETLGDVNALFKFLADGWEVVICRDMGKYHTARMMLRPDNHAEFEETMDTLGCEEVMQYNGGVFAFRKCPNVEKFFKLWNKEWQKYAGRDQGALLRALYKNPVRLLVLGNQWNASTRYPLPGEVIILHHSMEARRWGGLIYGRTDSKEAWERVDVG